MLIIIPILAIFAILFLVYASYNINSKVYINALCQAKTNNKVVALTFDDGPDPIQTGKVLDVLKEFDVKVCFFCIGDKLENNHLLARRIVEEGHLIGNHSYRHLFLFPLHGSTWVQQDLKACEEAIEKVTDVPTRLFRPPFGVTNPMIAKAVKKLGYITIGWSIRSLDTCRTVEKAMNKIKDQLHPGAVILLHDPLPTSEQLVRKVLNHLRENDYKVERIDTLFHLETTRL